MLSDILRQAHQCFGVAVFGWVGVIDLEGFKLSTVSLAFAYKAHAFHNKQTHMSGL